jgi:hypothetical protein
MTKNLNDGMVHSVTCALLRGGSCDCSPIDTSEAMRRDDVMRIFAPLPPEEAKALREFWPRHR